MFILKDYEICGEEQKSSLHFVICFSDDNESRGR